MTDPTGTIASPPHIFDDDELDEWSRPPETKASSVDLRSMLRTQLELTSKLQGKLNDGIYQLPPREIKELIGGISSILTLAHRTEEILKELDTYKLFMDATVSWLRTRQDGTGEDLVQELRDVASKMRTRGGGSGTSF